MTGKKEPREILVGSENALFRECLADRLEREIHPAVRTAAVSLPKLPAELARRTPEILILDSDSLDGISDGVLPRIRARFPSVRTILLIPRPNDRLAARLLGQGAAGVLARTEPFAVLVEALATVSSGGTWADRRVLSQALASSQRRTKSSARTLTPRERQVLTLLGDGYRNKEIAATLQIKEQTVKIHLHNVFRKLDVRTRVEAALRATEGSPS